MIRKELKDYIELWLIPMFAMFLPWFLLWRLYYLLAKCPFLYRDFLPTVLNEAKKLNLLNTDEVTWARNYRFGIMLDYADVFLCLTRGHRFAKRYIDTRLSSSDLNKKVLFMPHFGGGLWLYRSRALAGFSTYLLMNPVDKRLTACNLSCRFRVWVLEKYCKTTVVVPTNLMKIRQIIQEESSIVILPDVPRQEKTRYEEVDTEIGSLLITSSFFELATKRHLAVVIMAMGYGEKGERETVIEHLKQGETNYYIHSFASLMAREIKKRPHLWRMLVVAPEVMSLDTNYEVIHEKGL